MEPKGTEVGGQPGLAGQWRDGHFVSGHGDHFAVTIVLVLEHKWQTWRERHSFGAETG